MSSTQKPLKTRNTRNSQRLVNLQQQEDLYRKFGVTAMASKKEDPSVEDIIEEIEEGSGNDEGNEDGGSNETSPKVEDGTLKTKKVAVKKAKAKREHSISSESDSEKEKEKPVIKKKKKKKSLLNGKKNSLAVSPASNSFPVNADVHFSADGARQGMPRSMNNQGPLVFPQNLMVSPMESDTLTAHMNAYTNFLMENNLLLGQGQRNVPSNQRSASLENLQFGRSSQAQNQSRPPQHLFNNPLNLNQQPPLIPGNTQSGNQRGMLDDSSIDGLSNGDPLELLGPTDNPRNVAFLPEVLQPEAPEGPSLASNVREEVLLSQHCEGEKDVDQEDDNSVGPEISEKIMFMVKNFLGRSRKAAKIDDLTAEFLRPRNMPFLRSPKIEDEIYLDLNGQAKHFDKNCRGLQGYLNAAMTAQMRCMEMLISIEKIHPKITQAGVMAKKALQLMAFTNRDINDRRKDALKVAVNPDYLPLLKHAKPPSEEWLLGGSLTDAIKQCDESKRLTEKIMKARKTPGVNQQENQQQNFQNHFPQHGGRQKFRNRANRKDYKSAPYQNNNSRQNWTPNYQNQQGQHQQPSSWLQQSQTVDPMAQQHYQHFLNQAYQNQQNAAYFPQYAQQQQQHQQQAQQQQQLGFYQGQQPKNFYQGPQQFQPKRKN